MDEDDVALIDALHVNPRASFEDLGAALGLSAVTVGRRWRKLSSAGMAWVSSAPGPAMPLAGAIVEIDCAPLDIVNAARTLAAKPQVFSVNLTSGSYAAYALIIAEDTAAVASFLVDEIAKIPHVRQAKTSIMTGLFSGVHWRLGAIDSTAAHTLTVANPETRLVDTARELTQLDKALFVALQIDGRSTFRDLAQYLGHSEQSVKRRLALLRRTGVLTFRTDFVRAEGGWQTHAKLALRVPDESVHEVARRLGGWPEIRVCASVVGSANLIATVQTNGLGALDMLLQRVRKTWPSVLVLDRQVVLRSVKSWGRILDSGGRASSVVPVDPWGLTWADTRRKP